VIARPSHVERISLRLYSLLVDFASALLRFAQVAYDIYIYRTDDALENAELVSPSINCDWFTCRHLCGLLLWKI